MNIDNYAHWLSRVTLVVAIIMILVRLIQGRKL